MSSFNSWTKSSVIDPSPFLTCPATCMNGKASRELHSLVSTCQGSSQPSREEYSLVTWKGITHSLLPALLMASHLYKADTFAAWITRVLTVWKKKKSQAIKRSRLCLGIGTQSKLKSNSPPIAMPCLLHSHYHRDPLTFTVIIELVCISHCIQEVLWKSWLTMWFNITLYTFSHSHACKIIVTLQQMHRLNAYIFHFSSIGYW
jgi:hypothetical protein